MWRCLCVGHWHGTDTGLTRHWYETDTALIRDWHGTDTGLTRHWYVTGKCGSTFTVLHIFTCFQSVLFARLQVYERRYVTIGITGFLNFVHPHVYWKGQNVPKTRSPSILRWREAGSGHWNPLHSNQEIVDAECGRSPFCLAPVSPTPTDLYQIPLA
jgi:hypothetical protein